jgi:hypothetical protein
LSEFSETLDWVEGKAVHAGQAALATPFHVVEAWYDDIQTSSFQERFAARNK